MEREGIMIVETVWDSAPEIVAFKGHDDWGTYIPERTCHPIHTREKWVCSACGCSIKPGFMPEFHGVGVLRFCPNCGAKLVE